MRQPYIESATALSDNFFYYVHSHKVNVRVLYLASEQFCMFLIYCGS